MVSLISHDEDCTPVSRCRSCKVAAFLKENLSPEHFNELLNMVHPPMPKVEPVPLLERPEWDTPLADVPQLEFSSRIQDCLRYERITTVLDLVTKTQAEMLRIPNMGRKGLNEIKEELSRYGLWLGMNPHRDN